MSTSMHAKMQIVSVKRLDWGAEEVEFAARYRDNPEDNSYSEATPTGSIKLTITNKALHGQFNPGELYYVNFTPVTPSS